MSNPTIPSLDTATAEALAGTLHAGSGVTHIPAGVDDQSSPTVLAWLKNVERMMLDHIAGASQGRVIVVSGLNVGAFGMNYRIGATDYAYAGDASFAVTASQTNYLYLDATQTLIKSITGWPAGDHVKLAKVVAGASAITQVTDCRWMNFLVGIVNAWSSVAASQNVDLAGFDLDDIGGAQLSAASEKTIASGEITPTAIWHTVDTEADAAADDLVTITADAGQVGRLLILQMDNAARVTTIKGTGNVDLVDESDLVLDATKKVVVLQQHTATTWRVLGINFNGLSTLVRTLDVNGQQLSNIGGLNFDNASATISGGVLTVPANARELLVRSEVAANPDTLTTISGGADGDWLLLRTGAAGAGEDITIDSGAGNVVLNGGDWVMTDDTWAIVLRRQSGTWYEQFRSPVTAEALSAAGNVVPFCVTANYAGTVTDGLDSFEMLVGTPFTMKFAHGRVQTAPTGGSCVVDVFQNGASVFAAQANAINIVDGANSDVSDEITVAFARGDRLKISVVTANTAADLTVTIEGYAAITPA